VIILLLAAGGAVAQDKGTLKPHALPPLANPDDPKTPAKELFGCKVAPTATQPYVVGFYASGCLAGANDGHHADHVTGTYCRKHIRSSVAATQIVAPQPMAAC
jgi:hypothetical protein